MRILFVCTGNICRSPMAEGLARAVIDREYPEKRERFDFSSAGISALDGNAPAREAVEIMLERGIDIGGHRARNVTRSILEANDLVLTMEEAQRKRVERMMERAETPVFLLLELGEAARKALAARDSIPVRADGLSELMHEAGGEERDGRSIQNASRYEVPDPIGMPAEEYRYVAAIIEGPIENIIRIIAA